MYSAAATGSTDGSAGPGGPLPPLGVGEQVPGVKDRSILLNAITARAGTTDPAVGGTVEQLRNNASVASSKIAINWAHPAHVFPVLRQIMNSTSYLHDVISGMCCASLYVRGREAIGAS